jgi:hypothetical protein
MKVFFTTATSKVEGEKRGRKRTRTGWRKEEVRERGRKNELRRSFQKNVYAYACAFRKGEKKTTMTRP